MSGTTISGGRLLTVARAAWVVCAVLTVVVLVASVPVLYERFSSVCTDATNLCLERSEVPGGALDELRGAGISLGAYASFAVGVEVLCKMVWISVAALLFVFRSRDRMALLVSFFLLTFGTATLLTNGTDALAPAHPAWWIVAKGLQVAGEVFVVLFLLTFPDGRFVPRWTPVIAVVFLLFQIPEDLVTGFYTKGPRFLETAQLFVFFVGVLTMLGAQVYRYRRVSGPGQRRQTRWAVFGTTLAIAVLILVYGALFFLSPGGPGSTPLTLLAVGTLIPFVMLLIPLSISVAIFRSGLFDIDLVINRALVYGLLTASLVLVYVGGVTATQTAFRLLTGQQQQPQLAVVISTLAIAALFNPLRRRVQEFVDRRFYRTNYDAAKTLEDFGARLRNETDLDSLSVDLVGVVRETMQPAHVSLWLVPRKGRVEL